MTNNKYIHSVYTSLYIYYHIQSICVKKITKVACTQFMRHALLAAMPLIRSMNCAQITRVMGAMWGPSGDDRAQVGPWTLLSGWLYHCNADNMPLYHWHEYVNSTLQWELTLVLDGNRINWKAFDSVSLKPTHTSWHLRTVLANCVPAVVFGYLKSVTEYYRSIISLYI